MQGTWWDYGFLQLYTRCSIRLMTGMGKVKCFDVASVEIPEEMRGRGLFTQFLKRLDSMLPPELTHIYIECVGNARFAQFCRRIARAMTTSPTMMIGALGHQASLSHATISR